MPSTQGLTEVSVVVPVYNRRLSVGETVECLLRQSLPPREILVVDDGSTDGTAEHVALTFGDRVRVLPKRNGGPASARNHGIRAASCDLVAFTDSDCLPEEDWLAQLLEGFDSPKVAGTGGMVRRADSGLLSEYADATGILNPLIKHGEVDYLVTANSCFRRDALIEAGLFDERFARPGGEDTELSVRVRSLGYEFRFTPAAVVLHHHKQTLPSLLKTMSNYGEGCYLLFEFWPERRGNYNPYSQLFRGAFAVRNMTRRCRDYSREHGLAKGLCFAVIENYSHVAHTLGYLRGMRKHAGGVYPAGRPRVTAAAEPEAPEGGPRRLQLIRNAYGRKSD